MRQRMFCFVILVSFSLHGCGLIHSIFYSDNKGILRGDDCQAPGLEWMEAVEGYDKQEVIDLAAKFEAAAKADAELLKGLKDGSTDISITSSLKEIIHNTSGRSAKVSQAFFEKASTYRTSICNIERWLRDGTLSNPSVRANAQMMLLSLSQNFGSIAATEKGINAVVSINQQGGITAGTVNLGAPTRTLTPNLIAQLETLLSPHKNKTIDVVAVLGDQEAIQFATQIFDYLKSHGYKTSGVSQAVFTGPVMGQSINVESDPVKITIGTRQ